MVHGTLKKKSGFDLRPKKILISACNTPMVHGSRDPIGTWPSPKNKFYGFWLHYHYEVSDLENINLQPNSNVLVFIFFFHLLHNCPWDRKRSWIEKWKVFNKSQISSQKWEYPSKIRVQWSKVIISQFFRSSFETRGFPIMI